MFDGFQDLREGFRIIKQPGLRLFVFLPLIINILFFIGLGYWAMGVFSGWVEQSAAWLPEGFAFLRHVLWLLFAILAVFVLAYTFVFMATLIGAPFYGLLAEEVQKQLTGDTSAGEFRGMDLVRMVPRTLWRELVKILHYLPGLLVLLVLMFIPVVNVIVPVLWVIFSAWMMAFEFLDFPADANQQSLGDLKRMMKQRRSRSFGFGLSAWALTLVPIVNLFVLQAAVAGGVKLWLDLERQQRLELGKSSESASLKTLKQ